ncbi:MAG: zinc metalloprotease, partial [Prevotellaceae bacterium]|nr:zinc metalloprotease [Prevotellaceae bacterium]
MKTNKLFLSLIIFLFCINTFGQRTCGSDLNLIELQQTDIARYQQIISHENQLQIYLENTSVQSTPQTTIIIPVVVHVIYNNNAQNISDAQINSQIEVLNEDFRRLNTDKTDTPIAFANVAGNPNFEFKLAKIDPNGNLTNGITRTLTTKNSFSHEIEDMKYTNAGGYDAWNTQKYLNIWVCNFSNSLLCGYAQFPDKLESNPNTDGVVISYKYFGRNGSAESPYNKGRTATHEVGHWLDLYHIWGDANNCSATDFVTDTPNQYTKSSSCPSFPKTDICTSTSPGIMFMNYMDYTNDACMNMFTNGQITRMRALFDTQIGIRKQMLAAAEYITNPPTISGASHFCTTGIFSVNNLPVEAIISDIRTSNSFLTTSL